MAAKETKQEKEKEPEVVKAKSNMPLIAGGGVGVLLLLVGVFMFMKHSEPAHAPVKVPPCEYMVKERMYQLKDGSYLRLGFSIVLAANKLEEVKHIIEKESPGRLPDGINMVVGNKTQEDLINGAHRREAFAREIKSILEEKVFAEYNMRQLSVEEGIRVEEVLISDFVTQGG